MPGNQGYTPKEPREEVVRKKAWSGSVSRGMKEAGGLVRLLT